MHERRNIPIERCPRTRVQTSVRVGSGDDDGAAVLDHPDDDAEPLDGRDHPSVEGAVAMHVRRRDEEFSSADIARPLQACVGRFLEREPLATDRDQIATAAAGCVLCHV